MPTPAEIMAAATGTKPAEAPKPEAPKIPEAPKVPGMKKRFLVVAGHDKRIVEANTPEDAQAAFFKAMGILSTKHKVEINEVR